MSAHTVFDVARWFAAKNDGAIGSKKMQKLCYYAQAWHHALYDAPLFDGDFQAWVHGPVNKPLWDMFKNISYRDITPNDFDERAIVTRPFSDSESDFLERVWATYGDFTGYQLEYLTHQEEPWLEQRKDLHQYDSSSNVIRADAMRDYYRSLVAQGGNT